MDCEFDDKGVLKINLFDLFDNLDDETLDQMAEAYCWKSKAYKELVDATRNEYAGKNYNQSLYDLRKAFFLMPMEYEWESPERDIWRSMEQTIRELLKENAELQINNYKYENAKHALLEAVRQLNFDDEIYYKLSNVFHDTFYSKDKDGYRESVYSLSSKWAEGVKVNNIIHEWVDHVIELFRKNNLEV